MIGLGCTSCGSKPLSGIFDPVPVPGVILYAMIGGLVYLYFWGAPEPKKKSSGGGFGEFFGGK